MPAFLVPFVFVMDPQGPGLLLKMPANGNWVDIVEISLSAAAGIAAFAFAVQGWLIKKSTRAETALLWLSGMLFMFPSLITAILWPVLHVNIEAPVPVLQFGWNAMLGLIVGAAAFALQKLRAAGVGVRAA